jgi:TatA/E family protein of Tat protein translocase
MMPGSGEILFIMLLVLVLFGPDKLPDLARSVGKGIRELRKLSADFQNQLNVLGEEIDDDASRRSRPRIRPAPSPVPSPAPPQTPPMAASAPHNEDVVPTSTLPSPLTRPNEAHAPAPAGPESKGGLV